VKHRVVDVEGPPLTMMIFQFEATDRCYLGGFHNEAIRPTTTGAFHSWFSNGRDPHAAPDFAFDLRFGCQTEIIGSGFAQQLADGIMGMSNSPSAVWDQMYAQSKIPARAFSLCFQRVTETRRSGTESGVMTIGGSDPKLHNQAMAFTSLESGSFFSVQLRKVYLRKGGKNLAGTQHIIPISVPDALHEPDRKHVIIDSGTTDTYFTQDMRADFYKAWLTMVGTDFTNEPISLSAEELEALPSLVLQFQALDGNQNIDDTRNASLAGELDPEYPFDLVVVIPPSHFMEYHPDENGYVAGLFWDEPEGIVLGANTMMGHDILFDAENARLGWAESSCNYTAIAEGDTPTSNKLYTSPSLRFRQPQRRPPNRVAQNDRILLIASFVLVVAAVLTTTVLFLARRILWKSASANSGRPSSSLSGLTNGREIRRSVSRMGSREIHRSTSRMVSSREIQRSNSRSAQRASSEVVVQRQTRRNESRSILHAVQESHQEANQDLHRQLPRQFPSRILSERAGLLRSRSQQVERDRVLISTI
jgi:Eukaryotic aspartyl protease